jgi:hypothetical protein
MASVSEVCLRTRVLERRTHVITDQEFCNASLNEDEFEVAAASKIKSILCAPPLRFGTNVPLIPPMRVGGGL